MHKAEFQRNPLFVLNCGQTALTFQENSERKQELQSINA